MASTADDPDQACAGTITLAGAHSIQWQWNEMMAWASAARHSGWTAFHSHAEHAAMHEGAKIGCMSQEAAHLWQGTAAAQGAGAPKHALSAQQLWRHPF